jgi:hypothetical protein
MLRRAKALIGFRLHATDGDIGHVRDLYFDDQRWLVRHVVVDTGRWLPGRQVLVSPRLILGATWTGRRLETALTREQVRSSPPTATDEPVSHQNEIDPEAYVNILFFWTAGDLVPAANHKRDGHLHSARELTHYTVQAADADVGHVGDLMVDDASWAIESIVIDMRRWLPGDHVVVPSASVARISWLDLTLHLRMAADAVHRGRAA